MRLLLISLCAALLGACAAPPAASQAPAESRVARGATLFVNKGCITCHTHGAIGYQGVTINVGPDLSAYRNDELFLRTWLKDPAALRPNTTMPNLQLSEEEIETLIAFLNAPR
jgi:mono/diheme cytochrome c family protein